NESEFAIHLRLPFLNIRRPAFPPVRQTRRSCTAAGIDRGCTVLKLAPNSLARSVRALLSLGAVLPAAVSPPQSARAASSDGACPEGQYAWVRFVSGSFDHAEEVFVQQPSRCRLAHRQYGWNALRAATMSLAFASVTLVGLSAAAAGSGPEPFRSVRHEPSRF